MVWRNATSPSLLDLLGLRSIEAACTSIRHWASGHSVSLSIARKRLCTLSYESIVSGFAHCGQSESPFEQQYCTTSAYFGPADGSNPASVLFGQSFQTQLPPHVRSVRLSRTALLFHSLVNLRKQSIFISTSCIMAQARAKSIPPVSHPDQAYPFDRAEHLSICQSGLDRSPYEAFNHFLLQVDAYDFSCEPTCVREQREESIPHPISRAVMPFSTYATSNLQDYIRTASMDSPVRTHPPRHILCPIYTPWKKYLSCCCILNPGWQWMRFLIYFKRLWALLQSDYTTIRFSLNNRTLLCCGRTAENWQLIRTTIRLS